MIELRPFDMQNLTTHYEWNNDRELNFRDSEYPFKHEAFESFLNRIKAVVDQANANDKIFEIHHTEDDALIGVIYLNGIDEHNRRCFIDCTIGQPEYAHQGHEVSAMIKVLDYCFSELDLHKVYTSSFDFDEQWLSEVEALGFKREAVYRDHVYKRDAYHDKFVFGLLESEFDREAIKDRLSEARLVLN